MQAKKLNYAQRQADLALLHLSLDASEPEIKRSYKTLALRYHPDRNAMPMAEEKFKQITGAYERLIKPRLETAAEKKIQKERYQRGQGLLIGALLGMVFFSLVGYSWLWGVMVGALLGRMITQIRQSYFKKASEYYPEPIINNLASQELMALQAGIKAETWSGYLLSFRQSVTYCYPLAFAAGMELVEDPTLANKVLSRKVI